MTDEELTDLVNKIHNIEERVERNDYLISEVEDVVSQKKQRFADMDLTGKFERRENELNKLNSILEERASIVDQLTQNCHMDIANENT